MHATTIDPVEQRAGRRELVVVAGMLVAALVVMFLGARGALSSMMLFPHVFGVLVVLVALVSLRTAPRVHRWPRIALTVALAVVCVLSPGVHLRGIDRSLRAREQAGLSVLGGRPAPPIPIIEALDPRLGADGELRFGGRVTLVNFWAEWCGACIAEMPALEAFWAEQRPDGVEVVGVTKLYSASAADTAAAGAEIDSIRGLLADRSVSYPVVIAAESSPAHRAYRADALPTSVLIDRDGTIVDFGAGVSGTHRLIERARTLVAAE